MWLATWSMSGGTAVRSPGPVIDDRRQATAVRSRTERQPQLRCPQSRTETCSSASRSREPRARTAPRPDRSRRGCRACRRWGRLQGARNPTTGADGPGCSAAAPAEVGGRVANGSSGFVSCSRSRAARMGACPQMYARSASTYGSSESPAKSSLLVGSRASSDGERRDGARAPVAAANLVPRLPRTKVEIELACGRRQPVRRVGRPLVLDEHGQRTVLVVFEAGRRRRDRVAVDLVRIEETGRRWDRASATSGPGPAGAGSA